ncbi:dehydrogenase [Taibaiella lutea]|uniref:Dehydrogenase n=1 Tax=Taibaiella lutea TaxID=2608001 RepID=A0A5M6CQ24_9BACT|nr:dehydrogenase E1 component subunit alpha/beta [Taibaiella lutea]KAA5537264.1 dehydrogenase [Taibaiella lutea]
MQFSRQGLSDDLLLSLYSEIIKPRMIEEKMLILLRQGRVSKWFSGIGQEAISIGATMAMDSDEYIMPLHRNLGVFTARKMSFAELFLQWQGKKEGFSKGRERSFHFGSNKHHICGMISHLGPQLAIADGIALAHKLRKENKISLAFSGDGGTSEGDFHEALNTAAVWGLPVIFMIENNGYGLSTPINEQFVCKQLADKGIGYGMKSIVIDGNNLLEVYKTVQEARQYCITEQKPILIEAMTFRMRGHEEASGTKYVPKELFEEWGKKDPVKNYEDFLLNEKVLTPEKIEAIKQTIQQEIEAGLEIGFAAPAIVANTEEEVADVYKPFKAANTDTSAMPKSEKKMIQALSEGMRQAMEKHDNLILMGQDIAEYGGAFKLTEGLVEDFGKGRVRNTPLCESAIVGTALGLSIKGFKSMMEMQFADFVTVGFNQIINNLAKIYYRWGQNADVVVRMPTGGGVGAGPFHSQSNEAWFTHTPGLKVVYPSTPEDAKGLLLASFEDPNPVMFFEHKALYRSISGMVPDEYYTIEIGKAKVVQEGEDMTIITYGSGVHWAADYAKQHPELSIYILDLRTLLPLDYDAIKEAVMATGKVLLLHEDTLIGGIGGELSAWISENCFQYLDAPIIRCASLDTPVPFAIELEQNFLAKKRLGESVEKLMRF